MGIYVITSIKGALLCTMWKMIHTYITTCTGFHPPESCQSVVRSAACPGVKFVFGGFPQRLRRWQCLTDLLCVTVWLCVADTWRLIYSLNRNRHFSVVMSQKSSFSKQFNKRIPPVRLARWAYQYFHSNKVGRVLIKEVENNLRYFKADVKP